MSYSLGNVLNNRRKYKLRKEQGICTKCDNQAEPNRTMCFDCNKKDKIASAKRNKKKRELGVRILGPRNK